MVASQFFETANFGNETLTSNGNSDIALVCYDADGNEKWAKSFGNSGHEGAEGLAVATDGTIYLAGLFRGDMMIGNFPLSANAGQNVFFARFSANGSVMWAQSSSGTDVSRAYALCTTPNGGAAMTGSYRGEVTFGSHVLSNRGIDDIFVTRTGETGWK